MYVVYISNGSTTRTTTFRYYEDAMDCISQCQRIGLQAYIG